MESTAITEFVQVKKDTYPDYLIWVKHFTKIRDCDTGEVVEFEDEGLLNEEGDALSTFIWEDGNFSCDCNRRLLFERAKGNEPQDTPCGEERYLVNLYDKNKKIIYVEF